MKCLVCGKEIVGRKKYCSDKCMWRAQYLARREKKLRQMKRYHMTKK